MSSEPGDPWLARLEQVRYRGYAGGRIQPHRAIFHVPLQRKDLAVAILLPLAFTLLQLLQLDATLSFWRLLIGYWSRQLDFGGAPAGRAFDLGFALLWIPQPHVSAGAPSSAVWWATAVGCAALFAATFFIPADRYLPAVFIARACVLLQASALAVFYWAPGTFPYDLPNYVGSNLLAGLAMMLLTPWLLGLTYYIFAFPLLHKVWLTVLLLAYLTVALPMQYLLHAYLIKTLSMLFLPLLYLVGGVFLDTLIVIALYSWAMSWRAGHACTPPSPPPLSRLRRARGDRAPPV